MLCQYLVLVISYFFFFKQKTAYEMRISDWSSDVCSSDLSGQRGAHLGQRGEAPAIPTDDDPVAIEEHDCRERRLPCMADDRREPPPGRDRIGIGRRCERGGGALGQDRCCVQNDPRRLGRSEEHASGLQTRMRNSYAGFSLKKK